MASSNLPADWASSPAAYSWTASSDAAVSVSIDNLGENVANADEARASAGLYHHLLDAIAERKLNANISLKLTHMGLDVDENLAYSLVTGLAAKAASMTPRNFVRVDMEGSPYTERTLDVYFTLRALLVHRGGRAAVLATPA